MSPQSARVAESLGGRKVFGRAVRSDAEMLVLVREGLPFEALERIRQAFGLTLEEVSHLLLLPARTLARRKKARKLSLEESDRLFRLARIATRAEAVLGSTEKAVRWLHKSNRALGDQSPLSLVDTDIGAQQVEDVLARIEFGVYG